jgi:elongation factor G
MNPPVLLWITIVPKSEADRERLGEGLQKLIAEDPTLHVKVDQATGEVVIAGMGELQLEIVLDRLKREFKVEASVGRPQVAYKETVTRPAAGEMKYARQAGGRGQYGHVKIHLVPVPEGTGYVFRNEIVGDAIPKAFITSIEDGIRDALAEGILAGYPVDDVRIELYDGSYHDVDSSDAAFKTAAAMAFHDAAKKAAPVLLEPVMRVEVVVPQEHFDEAAKNLVNRRGQLFGLDRRDGMPVLTALVPLADLFGYASDLRQWTRGRARCASELAHYRPCRLSDEEGDRDAYVGAPLKRPPTLRDLRIALPEPDPERGASES